MALLPAQPPAADAAAAERELVARAIAAYHDYADAQEAARMYGRALEIRRELLLDYDEDDARARGKLGFVKVGQLWRRDPNALVLDKDGGDPKALRKVEQDWERTIRELTRRHQAVAELFEAEGNAVRAAHHWRRVLRFRPGDPKVVGKLRLRPFEGFYGTEQELLMLRRARAIRDGVAFLTAWEPPAELLLQATHPILTRATVGHIGVRTRHFRVWGSIPESQLLAAARWAERSLLLCRTVFAGVDGQAFAPRRVLEIAFVPDQESYRRVLRACADQFPPDRLRFLEEQVQLTFLKTADGDMRLYMVASEAEALDQAVRGAVQDALGLQTHGLWEGIGHAFCGFCFGKTLTFLVEQNTGHTVTSWQSRPLVPDLAVWQQIASESAWTRSDTPTSRLALLHASRFTNEERVKAWAMVDWLLRWRPELVLELERSRTDATRTGPEVEAEFLRRTGLALPELDARWREHWARGTALRDAMAAEPAGKAAEVADARALADAVNAARAAADVGPVGFYVGRSEASAAVHRYFEALARAEAERRRARPGVQVRDPEPPAVLGGTVLGLAEREPGPAVRAWLAMPGARDALLHPGRLLLGCSVGRHGSALDLAEPETPLPQGRPVTWPADGQTEVPAAVSAGALGSGAARVLLRADIPSTRQVGFPLSLHFFRELTPLELQQVTCTVTAAGRVLDGVPFCVQGSGDRTQAAPGCCVFVPAEPLPAGASVTVQWQIPPRLLPKGQAVAPITFTVAGS